MQDLADGRILRPVDTREESVIRMIETRKPTYITFDDWKILDELEIQRGVAIGRSRVKFTTIEEMLDALGKQAELMPAPK